METNTDCTLVVLKPDAVQRQLVGRILARFERKGLKIVALKMLTISREQAEQVYQEHKGRDFYAPLVAFLTAGPVVAAVLEGKDSVAVARSLMGATFGPDAAAGTIRGDFGVSRRYNLVHGADSPAAARREIAVFFAPDELIDYRLNDETWIYAEAGGRRL